MTQPEESRMLTVEEVARQLQVNPTTVRRWIRDKLLVATQVGPRLQRIKQSDLDAFLQQRGGTPPHEAP